MPSLPSATTLRAKTMVVVAKNYELLCYGCKARHQMNRYLSLSLSLYLSLLQGASSDEQVEKHKHILMFLTNQWQAVELWWWRLQEISRTVLRSSLEPPRRHHSSRLLFLFVITMTINGLLIELTTRTKELCVNVRIAHLRQCTRKDLCPRRVFTNCCCLSWRFFSQTNFSVASAAEGGK